MPEGMTVETLRSFGAHYGYDVSYMEHMLAVAPEAFAKFWKITEASSHVGAAPLAATFAAKIIGALAEDCGPCVQLGVKMAEEAGIPAAEIEAVLTRDVSAMSEDVAVAFRFADALARHDPALDEAREDVRARWTDRGVVDLTLAMQAVRMFPMMKVGLGFGKTCQRVSVGGRPVDVVKAEAAREAA